MSINGGYVSLSMRDVLVDYLLAQGQDAIALLGPRPAVKAGELARYPITQFAADLQLAKSALNEPLIGLAAGQTVQPHHLGVLGYVVQHCQTLAEAQLRLERYLRLVYDGNAMQFEVTEKETIIRWGIQQGYHGADVDHFLHAVLVSYGRRLVGQPLNPSRVEMVDPKPTDTRPYRTFYGCEPQFEADITRIGIRNSDLLLPVISPDPLLCEQLDKQASEALNLLPHESNLESDLRDALLPLIRRNETKLENLANQLNCSARTLQRRLTQSGQNFQAILDRLRFEMACMYMDRPELDIVDVALLCGFSEHSAFTRAFSRWAGEPPSSYRSRRLIGQSSDSG